MMSQLANLFVLALWPLTTLSSPLVQRTSNVPLPSETVFQLGNDTWIENIAVRSNSDLLLTVLTTPELYLFNPSTKQSTLLHTFDDVLALLGITETTPDNFAVVAGNYSAVTDSSTPGTYSIWSVAFTRGPAPVITKITDIPEASFLNGITSNPDSPETVFIADSLLGAVFRLDTSTGEYDIAIEVPEMEPKAGEIVSIGINGLHVHDNYLYWTNSFVGLYRIAIDCEGSVAARATPELIGPIGSNTFLDDFTVDRAGNAWVATDLGDTIVVYGADGKEETVVGSNTTLTVAGATSAAFGRGFGQKDILYVVTSGALASPINGTIIEGAKVVAVDTKGFSI